MKDIKQQHKIEAIGLLNNFRGYLNTKYSEVLQEGRWNRLLRVMLDEDITEDEYILKVKEIID
jgi:hypothetical protein